MDRAARLLRGTLRVRVESAFPARGQREHERQPREQRVAATEAAQEKGRARRALDGQRGVERREEPLESFFARRRGQ